MSKKLQRFKNILPLFIALSCGIQLLCAQELQTLTVFDGSIRDERVPICGWHANKYGKCEFVYPESSIASLVRTEISSIKCYSSSTNKTFDSARYRVFMKSINSTDQSDYYGETGATVVYEGSLSVSNGVLEIQFSTPYSYTGGNLLIGVYQTVTGSGSNTCYFYGQTVTGASIVGWDSSSLNNITASSSQFPNFLPKTTFDYTPQNTHPEGALPKVFSVSENTSVFFSQGNLQYIGSAETPYWKFADHQWDYLGTTTGQDSDAQNVDRDLFGWGTSGYNHGANCYQPWSTSTSNSSDYYAYGNSRYNLFDQTGQADWGYNAISNGGNQEDCGWRTLTKEEWLYLFKTRSTPSGIRYAKAKVNNVNGVILLPDDWNASYYTLNSTNSNSASYTTNTITATQWASLEQFGAVFLPAAGVAAHWLYVLLAMIF